MHKDRMLDIGAVGLEQRVNVFVELHKALIMKESAIK